MASLVSRPIFDASDAKDGRISVASNGPSVYYDNLDSPIFYEIIGPESEERSLPMESFAISASIETTLREFDLSGVKIPSVSKVRDYLYCFSDMVVLLRYVVILVRSHFDFNVQLSLEIYQDFETDDEYLTLYIRQNKYDLDTMNTIKQIRKKYRGLAKEIEGRFLLTTDFRPPR